MKIMFYAPNAAIWPHAFPEALVAEALKQEGNEIVYVGCGKQFRSYCVAMSAFGLEYNSPENEKEKICRQCERNKSFIRKEFRLIGPDIADELSVIDIRHIDEILNAVTPENYLDLEFSGIAVGRLALYEFLLNHKKNNLYIDPAEWPEFMAALRNSICSAIASLKILAREKPDRLITYNSFYSVNHVCCIAADKFLIPHYLLHAGNNMARRLKTLFLSKGYSYNTITRHPLWKYYRNLPCSSEQLGIVTNHLLALFEAKTVFVYSAPRNGTNVDLRRKFGISSHQKVLVATMSSHDERFAAVMIGVMPEDSNLVFPTQIDWIEALAEFVANRQDLFLIIRVHPREFPNKRESVTSEYASRLQSLLTDLPDNVKVNWPKDEISLYDIADISDLFLNSRSTTGMEMSLLGLPVLIYSPDQLYSYPSDLNYTANSREEYFLQIDLALCHGWDIEFSRMAYRWGVFQYCRATLDISESYNGGELHGENLLSRLINKIFRKFLPFSQQKLDCRRRARSLQSRKLINDYMKSEKENIVEICPENLMEISKDMELDALKTEFEKIHSILYPGQTTAEPGSLQEKIEQFIGLDRIN